MTEGPEIVGPRVRYVWRQFLVCHRGVGRYALLDLVAAELRLTAGEVRRHIHDHAFAKAPYDGPFAYDRDPHPQFKP